MLIGLLCVLAGLVGLGGAAFSFRAGRRAGARALWGAMLEDRHAGHRALERLAEAHGAKLELVELP